MPDRGWGGEGNACMLCMHACLRVPGIPVAASLGWIVRTCVPSEGVGRPACRVSDALSTEEVHPPRAHTHTRPPALSRHNHCVLVRRRSPSTKRRSARARRCPAAAAGAAAAAAARAPPTTRPAAAAGVRTTRTLSSGSCGSGRCSLHTACRTRGCARCSLGSRCGRGRGKHQGAAGMRAVPQGCPVWVHW